MTRHHPSCPGGGRCICPSGTVAYSCPWCPLVMLDRTGGDDVEVLRRFETHLDAHQMEAARMAVTA